VSGKTQLPLAIGRLLVASLAWTLVLAGAAAAATRSFAPVRQEHGTAVFKLKNVEPDEIEAAFLKIGHHKRKLNVERVRAGARRGVLRVRVRRAARRSSVDVHGGATARSNLRLVVVTASETLAGESVSSTTFAPSADSYTSAAKPSRNYGKASSLVTEGSPSRTSYLRFEISGLQGAVTHATLKLFARSNSSAGLTLHPVSDNGWGESAITYANAPTIGVKVAESGPMSSGTYVSVDATPLVKGNGGVSMAVNTISATLKTLDSREGTNKPSLVVETATTTTSEPPPASPPPPPTGTDPQPAFPVRAAFYYPWFPETWGWPSGSTPDSSNFTNFTPSLGFYDSGSVSVIQQHVRAMQYGGVGAGISSWWGPGRRTDTRFQTMLSATNSMTSSFRWALYHENESLGDPTVAMLASDLTYIRDLYASDPAYFRVNGRFVVFVYADGADGCGMADRWKQANAGINAYIVLKVFSGYRTCSNQPDGWHQYSPAAPADSQSGYSYAISPGFWKADEPTARLGRDLTRFKTNVRDMVASNAPFQLVTTFNEWGEGTAVESAAQWSSTSGYGDYLDALHDNGQ
jgi:hypothetical protein